MLVDIFKSLESDSFNITVLSIIHTSDRNIPLKNNLQTFNLCSFGMDLIMDRMLSMMNLSFSRGRRGMFKSCSLSSILYFLQKFNKFTVYMLLIYFKL